jgi:site-specific recombinase XerD
MLQLVVDFLGHLETARRNGAGSRNIRLAAIKSFMHFMEYRVPSALEQIHRILAIPAKKTDTRLVRHLTADEMQSILDAPDPTVRDGIRDRAMLHLCFAGGLRVSELVGLRAEDLLLQPQQASWFMARVEKNAACRCGRRQLPRYAHGWQFGAPAALQNYSSTLAAPP